MIQHALLLTSLTRLELEALSSVVFERMNIACEWHRLQALQVLSIGRFRLQLGPDAASLLQLQHLRQLSFEGSTSVVHSESDNEWFAALSSNLAELRPQVKLVVDQDFLNWFQR